MSTVSPDESFLAPDFALGAEQLRELEANQHTVVGLRADLTLAYRNSAWARFARANGAPDLVDWDGRPILEAISPELRPFFVDLFQRVQVTGEPMDHEYDCSSPRRYRRFRMRVLPLAGGGLLIVHHLVVDGPHRRRELPPDPALYEAANGWVTLCSHCRRARRARQPETWDWVPAYLDPDLPNVTHGLCRPCFRHYYPRQAARRDRGQLPR